MRASLCILSLLTLLMLAACTQAEAPTANSAPDEAKPHGTLSDVKKESKEAWDATTAYMTKERNRLGGEIQEMTGKVESKISELRARRDQPGSTKKAETDRQLIDWEKQRKNLENFQDKAESASRSAWDSVKTQWNKLRNEVQEQLDGDKP